MTFPLYEITFIRCFPQQARSPDRRLLPPMVALVYHTPYFCQSNLHMHTDTLFYYSFLYPFSACAKIKKANSESCSLRSSQNTCGKTKRRLTETRL